MKRKLTGKLAQIARKNPALFEELNRKLVSWEYDAIAEWLFESGFKGLWADAAKPPEACVASLVRYRGGHWQDWATAEAQRGELFKKAEKQFHEAKEAAKFSTPDARIGSAVKAKTIAVEAVEQLLRDKADPKALSMAMRAVVSAIAAEQAEVGLGQKGVSIEQVNEKLKLEREKFQFEAAKAALAHLPDLQKISARGGTNDQKIEQVGKLIFGEEWDK